MDGLRRDLQSANSPQAETAGQLAKEIATALTQARTLSHELYAVPPSPDGLQQALENLAERASDRGVGCVFAGEAHVLMTNQVVASHLYRIAQEAVHNALKHSQATRIELELARQPASVELRIKDNGIGLPAAINFPRARPPHDGTARPAGRRAVGGEESTRRRRYGDLFGAPSRARSDKCC